MASTELRAGPQVILLLIGVAGFGVAAIALLLAAAGVFSLNPAEAEVLLDVRDHGGGSIAGAVSGSYAYESARVVVQGLGPGALVPLIAGHAVAWVTVAAVAGAIGFLAVRISRGPVFGPIATRATLATGVIVAVGGVFHQVLTELGRNAAAERLARSGDVLPQHVDLDLTPVSIGVAIILLAVVFRTGARLRRDTEGLV